MNNPYYKILPHDKFMGDGFQDFIKLNFPDPDRPIRDETLRKCR
jgi:hypothetical protein